MNSLCKIFFSELLCVQFVDKNLFFLQEKKNGANLIAWILFKW